MLAFFMKRLASLVFTMLVVSALVFAAFEFTPGQVATKILGPFSTQDQRDRLMEELGLTRPVYERYFEWLGVLPGWTATSAADGKPIGRCVKPGVPPEETPTFCGVLQGELGYSTLYKQPVNDIIWNRLGNTLLLAAHRLRGHRAAVHPVRHHRRHARGLQARPHHLGRQHRHHLGPGIRVRRVPGLRSSSSVSAGCRGRRRSNSGAGWPIALAAGPAGRGDRALRSRLCGAHGARLDGGGDDAALHPHRHPEGPDLPRRDHEARAAQRHDRALHGHPAADQLPDHRRGGGRGGVRLSRVRAHAAGFGAVAGRGDGARRPPCSRSWFRSARRSPAIWAT